MGSNRYNKPAPVAYQPKAKVYDTGERVILKPCCACGGVVEKGYYGSWGNGGTCSKKCELVQESKMSLLPKE